MDFSAAMRGRLRLRFTVHFKDRGVARDVEVDIAGDRNGEEPTTLAYDYRVPIRHRYRFQRKIFTLAIKAFIHCFLFETGAAQALMPWIALTGVLFVLVAAGHHAAAFH